mgnify:CR=1 FL=1
MTDLRDPLAPLLRRCETAPDVAQLAMSFCEEARHDHG